MSFRGAIKDIDFKSCVGTVIPNSSSLEYDEETELRFAFDNVALPDVQKLYLVSGLQVFFSVVPVPYAGYDIENVTPALTGRYRARCVLPRSVKFFIPDLQIVAELEETSTFELGGVDYFRRNDEILVTLSWDEIIQSQIEGRVPKVIACGTLTARGLPFLTDNMKQVLRENSRRDNYELVRKPFGKIDRSSTPTICYDGRGRMRSKSFDEMPIQKCIGFSGELDASCARSSLSFMGFRGQLQAMSPAGFDHFHNPFVPMRPHAMNARANCHCFRY